MFSEEPTSVRLASPDALPQGIQPRRSPRLEHERLKMETFHVDDETQNISLFLSHPNQPDVIYISEEGIFFDVHEKTRKPHLYCSLSHVIQDALKDIHKTLPLFNDLQSDLPKNTHKIPPKIVEFIGRELRQLYLLCTVRIRISPCPLPLPQPTFELSHPNYPR